MSVGFLILTVVFIIVSAIMILIILVQRPQGGGLAGAFGGAGGGSTDTVFGGRVGDALTAMTVIAFLGYIGLAIALNVMDPNPRPAAIATPAAATQAATPPLPAPPTPPAPPASPVSTAPATAPGDVAPTTQLDANGTGETAGEVDATAPATTQPES